jgi:hypothetical protein
MVWIQRNAALVSSRQTQANYVLLMQSGRHLTRYPHDSAGCMVQVYRNGCERQGVHLYQHGHSDGRDRVHG